MAFNTSLEVNVFADSVDGTRHTLTVVQAVQTHGVGFNILVKLPDVKVDPQEVADLKSRLQFMSDLSKRTNEELDQWKKRFDALLFAKGGAA
jgi:hypothetical protein